LQKNLTVFNLNRANKKKVLKMRA